MLIKCNIKREGATMMNHSGVNYTFDILPSRTGNEVDKVCEICAEHAIQRFLDSGGLYEEWKPEEPEEVRQDVKDWVDESLADMGYKPLHCKHGMASNQHCPECSSIEQNQAQEKPKGKGGRPAKEKPIPAGEGPVTTPFSDDLGTEREPAGQTGPANEVPKPENNGDGLAELF